MKNKSIFDAKTLAICSMLTALSIVIGIFCKNLLNFGNGLFRITFENFPILLAGILYGPVAGTLVGAVSDTLSYILSTQTLAISPLITLGAAMVGLVSGATAKLLKKRSFSFRIVISAALGHLVGSIIIKSIGLYAFYGSYVFIRIPTYLIICALEIFLIHLVLKNKAICKIFNLKR